MKFKTTQKAIKQGYANVIGVSYGALQNLLECESEIAYTSRREGWAADIYHFGNTAIVTGYAPFGNIRPGYELCQKYEHAAAKIREYYNFDYEKCKSRLREAIQEFIEEVIQ